VSAPFTFRLVHAQPGQDWRDLVLVIDGTRMLTVGRIWRDQRFGDYVGRCAFTATCVRSSYASSCRVKLEQLVTESMACAVRDLMESIYPPLRIKIMRTLAQAAETARGAA
jgi:hypothetical protein